MNGPLGDLTGYLGDGANWSGPDGLLARILDHLGVSALSLAVALLVAVPLALWLGHIGKGGVIAINAGNAARAVPSFAVLVVLVMLGPPFGANLLSFVIALSLFSLPPLLTNTYVGVREVAADVVDAAQGVGMSGWQVLRRVEVPLAMPLIMTGVRLAAVQVVATTTVIGLVGGGGLGRTISAGFGRQDQGQIMGAALVVTLLALATEGIFELLERRTRGARSSQGSREVLEAEPDPADMADTARPGESAARQDQPAGS